MAASQNTSLPQGFSIYQPALGEQLQFFPAVGTQQLDDLLHAYAPGPASIQEKRTTVSLDFLEYTQLTGQAFKFYPVYALGSAATSPATASSLQDSASSSFNVSPVTPSWDWSQASVSSSQSRQPRKAGSSSASRRQATDFSHLPGMQIMTKDGCDVTGLASRGSKSKEQRDHAHLMRVIKACDACRRRKTRCDPSHKKRAASQAQSLPAPKTSKKVKKATQIPDAVGPSVLQEHVPPPERPFDVDASFGLDGLEDFDFTAQESWEQFVDYPADFDYPAERDDYDFFLDPEGFLTPDSSFASSSSSASPLKSPLASSQEEQQSISPTAMLNPELQTTSPQLPFLDRGGTAAGNYTDFNLYSPQSSFSEDDRMIPIHSASSSGRLPSPAQPLDPGRRPPAQPSVQSISGVTQSGAYANAFQASGNDLYPPSDYYDGGQYYDPGRQLSGDATGGFSFASASAENLTGAAIELSMRITGEASTFVGEEQARETANIRQFSSPGPVSGNTESESTGALAAVHIGYGTDLVSDGHVLHEEPTPGVAGLGGRDGQQHGSASSILDAAASTSRGTFGSATEATPVDLNGVQGAQALPADLLGNETSSSGSLAEMDSASMAQEPRSSCVDVSSPDSRVELAEEDHTTAPAYESAMPTSQLEAKGEDVLVKLAAYQLRVRHVALTATARAVSVAQVVVSPWEACASMMALVSPGLGMVVGLTLASSALSIQGSTPPALFAMVLMAVVVANARVSRSDVLRARTATTSPDRGGKAAFLSRGSQAIHSAAMTATPVRSSLMAF